MADTLYHIVGYLPHTCEFINLGTAITEQKARLMADGIVIDYNKNHTLPMMYSILPCRVDATIFHGPDHIGVALGNVPMEKFEPVKARITDEAYARRLI